VAAVKPEPAPTCAIQPIPYPTSKIYDNTLPFGNQIVKTSGRSGMKKVCVNQFGNQTSSNVVLTPTTQVVRFGTYIPPAATESTAATYRVGAICSDGTRSHATGSGACSWHGGVYQWLYSNN